MKSDVRINPAILQAALVGFRQQAAHIEAQIAEVEGLLAAGATPTVTHATQLKVIAAVTRKRGMSAAGRAAIRASMKRRWADYHAGKAPSPTGTKQQPRPQKTAKRVLTVAQPKAMRLNAVKARKAAARSKRAKVVQFKKAS
jgi:hypothetical protein